MRTERASAQLLVVDDDESTRRLLRRQLEAEGHAIVEAVDLASAGAALARARFDLVLLDLHLGTRSGLELFRMKGVEMPATIVISGAGDDAEARAAHAAGAREFLKKPLSGAALRRHVRHALRGPR